MGQEIILQGISKSFSDLNVLSDLTVKMTYAEITCIMGPSGSGKTTLLNLLLGLSKPDCGSIHGLDGKPLAAVFQEDRLCEQFDAIENVKLASSNKLSNQRIMEEFQKVRLTDYENKPVNQLSGGMKRRVAIIRAILADTEILIMDEPIKGLDAELKQVVLKYIKNATKGKTVIMVTHDLEEAQILGANIIEMH